MRSAIRKTSEKRSGGNCGVPELWVNRGKQGIFIFFHNRGGFSSIMLPWWLKLLSDASLASLAV